MGLPYLSMCPANILITSNGTIKLAHALDYYIIGADMLSQNYQAPEEVNTEKDKFLFKIDTWGLGVIALECLNLTRITGTNLEQ